ncbi:MAG: hypothetical protein M1818_008373 [Claussenomyces sp. TS43310]|nr:MAG: hypothetical protein M1818_008373 [Claussenomyces sp. TS43310]
MPPISIPTKAALPPSQRLPSNHPTVSRIIPRLSRASLLSLALDWLDDRNQALSMPYLANDEDDDDWSQLYPAAQSVEELRELYTGLQALRGSKKEIADRILEGDWRHGISLYQLAMADMQYLYDHPTNQKWTALKIVPVETEDEPNEAVLTKSSLPSIPRFHPATFLLNLQNEGFPDIKAHYNLDRHATLPLLLLRIFILESPYNTSLGITMSRTAAGESSRTVFVAFPDAAPHVFISLYANNNPLGLNNADGTRSLRKVLQDGIPKAFSRPRARYTLEPTNLTTRSLASLCAVRGAGRTNAAAGGWGVYAEEEKKNTPLDSQILTPPHSGDETGRGDAVAQTAKVTGLKRRLDDSEDAVIKRRKAVAQARFGRSGQADDKKGIERLDIRFEDPFPMFSEHIFPDDDNEMNPIAAGGAARAEEKKRKHRRSALDIEMDRIAEDPATEEGRGWVPDLRMTFHGSHVFAGFRELVEAGIIDGAHMPGWMTGEEGVSIGIVKNGRIKGFKGSGV